MEAEDFFWEEFQKICCIFFQKIKKNKKRKKEKNSRKQMEPKQTNRIIFVHAFNIIN